MILILGASVAVAQNVYEIPFPEGNDIENTIELSIANTSAVNINQVTVEATGIPAGIKFREQEITLTNIKAKEEQPAEFTFTVDKKAQLNTEQTISFTITDKNGQQWTKDIKVTIAPPKTYELYQNYPNPFNPMTTIEYQLPAAGTQYIVSLKIYDITGREITTLVNEQQEPGYYQKTFDAGRYSSGVYIYRLTAKDGQNNHHVFQKKMVLLR
jgi:hypothetical protein